MTYHSAPYTIRWTKRDLTIFRGEKVLFETTSLLPGYGKTPEDAIENTMVELAHDDPRLEDLTESDDAFEMEIQMVVDDMPGRFEVFAGELAEVPDDATPLAVDGDLPDDLPIRTLDDLGDPVAAARARIKEVPDGETLIDTVSEEDWHTPDPDGRIEVGAPARPDA